MELNFIFANDLIWSSGVKAKKKVSHLLKTELELELSMRLDTAVAIRWLSHEGMDETQTQFLFHL